uniref:Uncharacterized protein n=1 Tax=Anguilla anguilla TaxID=7936 RepID=A0A0E9XNT1_ANGAN
MNLSYRPTSKPNCVDTKESKTVPVYQVPYHYQCTM